LIDPTDPSRSNLARFATRVAFLASGLAMAAWAPLVPLAKARTGVDEATLGLILLCLGGGSLVAMPLTGFLQARFGTRRVLLPAVLIACGALPLLAIVDSPLALAASVFAFGAGLGAWDVAMNLQAVAVERAAGRAMMSGFHAMFSVGGIVGASGVSLVLGTELDDGIAMTLIAAVLIVAVFVSARGLLTAATADRKTAFAIPHGVVLVIGLLAAFAYLVEGAMLDWSALLLSTAREVPIARAGYGYVAFSIAMTAGRFGGDRIVQRLGGRRTLVASALVAALGLVTVALVPSANLDLVAFALVGFGCANIVPILFTSAGRQTAMPASLAVPAMTTMAYAGLLAGPAGIGFVAHASSLTVAFLLLAVLLVVVAIVGRRLAV
jgi:MFS family permease